MSFADVSVVSDVSVCYLNGVFVSAVDEGLLGQSCQFDIERFLHLLSCPLEKSPTPAEEQGVACVRCHQ